MDIHDIYKNIETNDLTERERFILRKIVRLYILKASPIGSRVLAKYLKEDLDLSAATIRNVMSDLEELSYISHPHTSAGRIPTDKGYRFYVNSLKEIQKITDIDLVTVQQRLTNDDSETALREASKMLGMLSKYLGVVRFPHLKDMIVQKIELISITQNRILVVIALESNIVRTVTLEAQFDVDTKYLEEIRTYISEKVSGKKLGFLQDNFKDLINDFELKDTPFVQLFVDSVDKIFERHKEESRVLVSGTHNLLEHPEFEDLSKVRGVIELVESEDVIIHLFDNFSKNDDLGVVIGSEMDNRLFDDYAFVNASYKMGSATGSIGLIGPKRMDYPKMISLVQSIAGILSDVSPANGI